MYRQVDPSVVTDFDRYAVNFPTRKEIMQHYGKSWYALKRAAGLGFLPQQLSAGELLNMASEIFADEPVSLTSLQQYGITTALLTARFGSVEQVFKLLKVTPAD
ncbi:hypothetical protein [Loigolactobacillus jiayinensis]|uniref:Uncharacterized protein n=1 Tax=Loigolactobacillus jiayinensis TaxID=2486016 RepID=A0ABW1RHF4_9LACO|nr:hypothetical protein [Loigolactobacillus jiayinensis]